MLVWQETQKVSSFWIKGKPTNLDYLQAKSTITLESLYFETGKQCREQSANVCESFSNVLKFEQKKTANGKVSSAREGKTK